jgi:transposase
VIINTKHQYKAYTSDFKTEALALVSEQGYTVQEEASASGIITNLLYSWKKKARERANSTANSNK